MIRTMLMAAVTTLLLSGCSKDEVAAPAQPEVAGPTSVTLYFSAAAGLNPGANGQAAPVRVRILELKNSASFSRADYFALAERGPATLGADLVDQDEVLVQPGEQVRIDRPLNPLTRQIGLVVGYREIDQAQWRSLLPVPPLDYQISLDVRAVRSVAHTSPTSTAQ